MLIFIQIISYIQESKVYLCFGGKKIRTKDTSGYLLYQGQQLKLLQNDDKDRKLGSSTALYQGCKWKSKHDSTDTFHCISLFQLNSQIQSNTDDLELTNLA